MRKLINKRRALFAGLPIMLLILTGIFFYKPESKDFGFFKVDDQGIKQQVSEDEARKIGKKEKKAFKESNMQAFYLPKTLEEVSAERDMYLKQHGSFGTLGENLPGDNPVDSWSNVGPMGIYDFSENVQHSGRVVSFEMFGDNANIMFCGAASGGLWKSSDAGLSWFKLMDTLSCPTVSSIACSQLASDNTVWFSTGSEFNGAGVQIGRVYKSTNGGSSFTSVSTFPLDPGNICKIEINPYDKNRVFVGCQGGLFKTTNGGTTFNHIIPYGSVVCDVITYTNLLLPDTANVLAAIEGNGIWRSTNGGNNFSLLTLPGYNTAEDGRITLAANPSFPNRTFAYVGRSNGQFLGLWFSTDKGATWTQKTLPSAGGGQQKYNQGLAVTGSRVFLGNNNGVTFYSTDDGTTWNQSGWTHPDVHKIHPYSNTVIYQVNDGGFFRSTNSGVNWNTFGNEFLQISQAYAIYASTSLPNSVWIGTQDNGVAAGYDNLFNWTGLTCCDGGVYFQQGGYQYMSLEYGAGGDNRLQRKLVGAPIGDPWQGFAQGIQAGSTVFGQLPPKDFFFEGTNFYTHMGQIAYVRSTSATTWSQLGSSTPFGANPIGKMGYTNGFVMASSENVNNPLLRRYNPSSNNWETLTLTAFPSGVVVTDFDKGSNVNNIFCTVSGTSGGRIFKSTNNGSTWINITGNLPNLVNARNLLTNKANDNIIYIGTDFGVYATGNGGVNWYNYSNGLPRVPYIMGLTFENNNNNLYVATYGRGVFKSQVLTGIAEPNSNIPSAYNLQQNYPNPFNPSTTIKFDLPVSGLVNIQVFDIAGRLVKEIAANQQYNAGSHEVNFNASELSSGTYLYRLTSGSFTDVKKMTLVK